MVRNETINEKNWRLLSKRFEREQIKTELHKGFENGGHLVIAIYDGNENEIELYFENETEKYRVFGNEICSLMRNENGSISGIGIGNEHGIIFENELLTGNENENGNEFMVRVENENRIGNGNGFENELMNGVKNENENETSFHDLIVSITSYLKKIINHKL